MGTCIIVSYCKDLVCGDVDYIGHKIFLPINTELTMESDNPELSNLIASTQKDLLYSESIRKEIADKFEKLLVETGACVLKRPTFERGILSFIIQILIQIKLSSTKKVTDIQQLNFLSLFQFSLSPPFLVINQTEVQKIKEATGFDFDTNESIKNAKDAIIDFLRSLSKVSAILDNRKKHLQSSLKSLSSKIMELKSFSIEDYQKKSKIYEKIKKSFDFCVDIMGEMVSDTIEIGNSVLSGRKMSLWMKISDDAIINKRLDHKEIVFYYAKGKKSKNINNWKENITYQEIEQELEY